MTLPLARRVSGLVVKEARRIAAPSWPWFDDLVQVGKVALWREGPWAVRWRMLDWLDKWRGRDRRGGGDRLRDAPLSLDAPTDHVTSPDGWQADVTADPADVVVARDLFARLSAADRAVLVRSAAGWTLDDIARERGVTRGRACQLRQRARRALAA